MNTKEKILQKKYDVIISGAGPAGCAAAIFLARKGISTLLVDKAEFPREKICGDGISAYTVHILERMGILNEFFAHNPWPVPGIFVSSPSGKLARCYNKKYDNFHHPGFVMPRKIFDAVMLKCACAYEEVLFVEKFNVKDIIFDGETAIGLQGKMSGKEFSIYGKYILAADGANSTIAKRISLHIHKDNHRAFALRAYFNNVEDVEDAIEIHYEKKILPGYGWFFPVSETRANVGVGVYTRFLKPRDIRRLFNIFIEKNKFVSSKLKNATMIEGSLKGFPLTTGSSRKPRAKGNIVLIGDAASLVDPLTGEGICNAITSAELASEAITLCIEENLSVENAGLLYEKYLGSQYFYKDFITAYMLQPLMTKAFLINFNVWRARYVPGYSMKMAGAISHILPKRKLII